jgi:hypothetical protein
MHRISKKVVTLQPKGCENGRRLSNWNKFHCVRLAPSLHTIKAIWWLMPPDVRESGESPELYLQL